MTVRLSPVALPDFGPLGVQPEVPSAVFAARADEALRRAGTDWLAVYADREHFGNIAFLSGFEPRFEEALLLLGPDGRRVLLTGNESESYAPLARLPGLEILLMQGFSLMGQDRSRYPRLGERLKDAGIGKGQSIGVVGWKYMTPEVGETEPGYFVPDFVIEALAGVAGGRDLLSEATPYLLHPANGLRTILDIDQIAAFEWIAAKVSSQLWPVVAGARPGETEFEALSRLPYEGDPLNVHTMFASASAGENVIGLRSPTARKLRQGDGVTTALGLWGALSSRAGLLDTENAEFLEVATHYFNGLCTWYETVGLGVPGGTVDAAVKETLAKGKLRSALNPGHLGGHEEWHHTPIRPGSTEQLASGMLLQVDVIPTPLPAGWSLNCEDTVVLADAALRAEIAQRHPQAWARIEARRKFMAEKIGVPLKAEILPLSSTPLYLAPFWLRADHVLTRA
ncbi:Xaa-Pro aminopeptidase [Devosia sp. 17-2-E-8]|nr:Xaa-Pro aminopeptidase [Devosia sp. 17-2-E-8]